MSLEPTAVFLVLLSALMHAAWHLMAKMGQDRLISIAVITGASAVMSVFVLLAVGLPAEPSWPYLIASCVSSLVYFFFLTRAYRGDLSVAYPVSRGVAPLLVLLVSAVWLREAPSAIGLAGVLLISSSILILAKQHGSAAGHTQTLLWAGGVGLTIAICTVVDGLGGRRSDNVIGYVAAQNALMGAGVFAAACLRRGGRALAEGIRVHWRHGLLGGALMLPSYVFVVYALSVSPIALVAALRESSVVFAAILGLIFLREPFGVRRIFASAVLATGIALLVLAPHSY